MRACFETDGRVNDIVGRKELQVHSVNELYKFESNMYFEDGRFEC